VAPIRINADIEINIIKKIFDIFSFLLGFVVVGVFGCWFFGISFWVDCVVGCWFVDIFWAAASISLGS